MSKSISQNLLEKIKPLKFWLSIAPFVRLVGVNGSVARGKADKDSDIDFLVVAKSGRIWTVRFLVSGIVWAMGLLRGPNERAGKVCLNCFLTDKSLNIDPKNEERKKVALSNLTLLPLTDVDETYEKFMKTNQWMGKFGKFLIHKSKIINHKSKIQSLLEKILSKRLGDFLEKKLKKYQLRRILRDPRTNKRGSGQVATDRKIRFLERA